MEYGLAARLMNLGDSGLQFLIDSLPFGIAIAAQDGSKIEANREFQNILGSAYTAGSGESLEGLFRAGGVEWSEIDDGSKSFARVQFRMPSGAAKALEVMVIHSTEESNNRKSVIVIVSDVSLNHRIERALSESESRARGYFDQDLVGMARISKETRFLEVNHTLCRFVDKSRDELLNLAQFDLISPEYQDDFQLIMADILSGRVTRCVQETLINGSEGSNKWMRIHYSRENSPAGAFETLVAIYEDITAEKELARAAEHRRQQLIRADRMSTLGTLTAGTAHEISNPNQVILGNAELAEEAWSGLRRELQISDEKLSRYISRIVEGARRIDGIVENLKGYVRSAEAPGPELMDVNETAMRAASMLDQTIEKATASFSIDLEPNLPPVSANPGRIEQVAINFLMNACQALPDRSKNITLRTRREGQFVTMEVADEGSGISEEIIDKITDPFVTSRRETGGTGLGLSVCDGIAREYGGILDFANRPEGGAVVRLHLPVAVY